MTGVWKYSFAMLELFYVAPAFAADPAHHEANTTIPHMDVSTFPSQLFWLTICFGLLYLIMSRVALPQIQDILNRRQSTVTNNLEKSAKLRDEAEDIQIAYDKALRQADNHAQDFLNNSIDELNKKNAAELSKSMDSIVDKIQKAEADIAKQRDKAIKEAEKIANDVASVLTEKILEIQKTDTKKPKKRA